MGAGREENAPRLCLGLLHLRQKLAVPVAEKLHEWMLAQRELVPGGSATAKALDYSLKRWVALTRYMHHGAVPIDNNSVENTIRPWALGRSRRARWHGIVAASRKSPTSKSPGGPMLIFQRANGIGRGGSCPRVGLI